MRIFHKLFIGIKRIFQGGNIGYNSSKERYGKSAENTFVSNIQMLLPDCEIKSNVVIHTDDDEYAEIDCLILYDNNLFAVEVKHWKGSITEKGEYFLSEKADRYTDEFHRKIMKSPFMQIKRAVYLLKKITNSSAWIEPIVFFDGASSVNCTNNSAWFSNIYAVVDYIKIYRSKNNRKDVAKCFNNCRETDRLYSGQNFCDCIIDAESFQFNIDGKVYSIKNIFKIDIRHHFCYDELTICTKTGGIRKVNIENGEFIANHNKTRYCYRLSKLDCIYVGN